MDVGAELGVVAAVEGVTVGDDAAVVVGAAEPPPPPHAGNSTASPQTANIETTFREVAMPDRLLDGGTLDRTREWNPQSPSVNVVVAPYDGKIARVPHDQIFAKVYARSSDCCGDNFTVRSLMRAPCGGAGGSRPRTLGGR
jgi:hypothetical protein